MPALDHQPSMDESPALAPPGAGIPWYERIVARRILLPIARIRTPWDSTPGLMQRQAEDLIGRARSLPEALRGVPVLVPPLPGLEDSSRYWSAYMVFDHLARVNYRLAQVVVSLTSDQPVPAGPNRIEELKPTKGIGAGAIVGFRESVVAFERAVRAATLAGRRSRATQPHPWFGPLVARDWTAFAPMHQSLHARQMREIVARSRRAS